MSLRRARQRKRITITSLIDVIFLLLLFFMLASTFSKFSEINVVTVAQSGAAKAQSTDGRVHALTIDRFHIRIDGKVVALRNLANELSQTDAKTPQTLTIEVVSEDVSTQRLTDVLVALKDLPDTSLSILEPAQ